MLIRKIKIFSAILKNKNIKYTAQENMFFVHIPKTAGTSFRSALENTYNVIKDYGKDSKQTSDIIKKYAYENNDLFKIKQQLSVLPGVCFTGHTSLGKYINLVPITNTISFVRKPLEQILSHYNHYVQHHGFKGDLNAFLEKPFAKNLQSKCLSFMPLGLMGYVGLTEHYDESLTLINTQFCLDLPSKKVNVNKTKLLTVDLLDTSLKDLLIKNNQRDIAMYQEAEFLHKQRVGLHREHKVWTYGCAMINHKNMLRGCAYQYNTDKPVSLIVNLNHETFRTIIAKNFYGAYAQANFPRERYVGFQLLLPKNMTSDDVIDIYVEETGQKLNFRPLNINSSETIGLNPRL